MKKTTLGAIIASVFFALCLGLYAQPFFKDKTLNKTQVKAKWGSNKLDFSLFKNGKPADKAKMAYSILANKELIGKPIEFIRESFGTPDGFYFIDIYPAYIIQEGETNKDQTWQIVFKLNEKYQVREVIVHLNCCD
jgi:hypothetical protein